MKYMKWYEAEVSHLEAQIRNAAYKKSSIQRFIIK